MSESIISNDTTRRLTAAITNVKRLACLITNVCNDNEPAISEKVATKIKNTFGCFNGDTYEIASRLYEVNVESENYQYSENNPTKLSKEDFGTVNPSDFILADSELLVYQVSASAGAWVFRSSYKPDCEKNPYFRAVKSLSKFLEHVECLLMTD